MRSGWSPPLASLPPALGSPAPQALRGRARDAGVRPTRVLLERNTILLRMWWSVGRGGAAKGLDATLGGPDVDGDGRDDEDALDDALPVGRDDEDVQAVVERLNEQPPEPRPPARPAAAQEAAPADDDGG